MFEVLKWLKNLLLLYLILVGSTLQLQHVTLILLFRNINKTENRNQIYEKSKIRILF